MDSAFNEQIIKKQPDVKSLLLKLLIVAGAAVLIFVALVMLAGYLLGMNLLLAAGIGYGAYWLLTSLNIEFEYSIIQDEIYIDKIINRRRRKRLVQTSCRKFEILAPVAEAYKREFDSQCAGTVDCTSSPSAEGRWFFIFDGKRGRTKVIFEPTDRMITEFKVYIRPKVKG